MRSRVLLVLVLVIPVVISQGDGYYSKLEAKHYRDYSLVPEFHNYDRFKYSPSFYGDDQFLADFPGGFAHDLQSSYAHGGFVSNTVPAYTHQGGFLRTNAVSPYTRRGFLGNKVAPSSYARRGFVASNMQPGSGFHSNNIMQSGSGLLQHRSNIDNGMSMPDYTGIGMPQHRSNINNNRLPMPYHTGRRLFQYRSNINNKLPYHTGRRGMLNPVHEISPTIVTVPWYPNLSDSPYYQPGVDPTFNAGSQLSNYKDMSHIKTPAYYDEDKEYNFSLLPRHQAKMRSLQTNNKASEVQG
ncbi:hypothetical protein HN011_005351 [Eciton burchellii]|nr:hypothetical protein HN011_005351 [Eciton burchellii]